MNMDCLITNQRDTISIATKVYDYIYIDKPIVAFINEDSADADLLCQFKHSFIVNSKESFINAITRISSDSIAFLDENLYKERYCRRAAMDVLLPYIENCI